MPILSILIPTYNRREGLIRTLKALQAQKSFDFCIVISDNCSNYSIEKDVLELLDFDFRSRINMYHQPFNVGGTDNIIGLLGLCKTEWAWILGDDDLVDDFAVEKVMKSIQGNPDVGGMWFTLEDDSSNKSTIVRSMTGLLSVIESIQYNRSGDFIFCSSKVYNIKKIKKYMEIVHRFSYTRIAQCFPFVELLKDSEPVLIIRGDPIVKHSGGKPSWDISKTVSGLSTLIDYPTGMQWDEHCRFVKAVMFDPRFVFSSYLKAKDLPWNYRTYLKNVYNCCYKHCYSGLKGFYIRTFCTIASHKSGYRLIKTVLNQKRSLRNKKGEEK